MSVYREHIAPTEPVEDYITRIEKEKREDRWKQHQKGEPLTLPPTRPAVPILGHGLTMAPMNVVMT